MAIPQSGPVDIYLNDGTESVLYSNNDVEWGSERTFSELLNGVTPTRSSYRFLGFSQDSSSTIAEYSMETTLISATNSTGEAIDVYCIWEAVSSGTIDTAFAVYSADDYSLRFYKRDTVPTEGDIFEGLTATAVYTGIETDIYSSDKKAPWYSYRSNITSAVVVDEGIAPVSTAYWFYYCSELTAADLGKLDTSSVASMACMFRDCSALTTLNISDWDTSSVTYMTSVFSSCSALTTLNISGWDTSSVTYMTAMFYSCSALTTLNVSSWDTSSVMNMTSMFYSCSALTNLNISSWDTSKVTSMTSVFYDCSALTTLNISDWDTSSVTYMTSVFSSCSALTTLNISGWDTSSVMSMTNMFRGCSNLTTIYAGDGWSTAAAVDISSNMFLNCTAIKGQSGTTYDSSKIDAAMANWETGYLTYKRYVKPAPYLIQNTSLIAIADAIRAKTGSTAAMTPVEMVTAIETSPTYSFTVSGLAQAPTVYYQDASGTLQTYSPTTTADFTINVLAGGLVSIENLSGSSTYYAVFEYSQKNCSVISLGYVSRKTYTKTVTVQVTADNATLEFVSG